MQETRIWSLGWEDPLEREVATHSSIHGEFHEHRNLAFLQSMGLERVGHDWVTNTKAIVTLTSSFLVLKDLYTSLRSSSKILAPEWYGHIWFIAALYKPGTQEDVQEMFVE